MKYSKLFGKTRHDPPCDADSVNAKLLTQAGFIEKVAAGIYNILPLGWRVLNKINTIIREEMNSVGGQELLMPALHPIALWETTGRDRTMSDILYRTKASGNKEFVFGPSHEETVTPLAGRYIQSYKDMPFAVYQVQTKFRDEPRAKSGLLRGREFGMKDMYSFHTTEADLDNYYEDVLKAYSRVYERCGMKAHVIEASGGPFSDKLSHEFAIETPAGEDTVIFCEKCGIAQNLEVATGKVSEVANEEEERDMKEVEVKRKNSVEANAKAHDVEDWRILKTVVYEVEGEGLVGVVIRGDLSVSETKLQNYLKKLLRPATPETLKAEGLVRGFISPVNAPEGISFIADHSVKSVNNWVTGANKQDLDFVDVNMGRDFQIKDFTDLVEVSAGFKCQKCDGQLKEMTAIEAGNIFKLGTKYSEAFDVKFTDSDGKQKLVVMGCYGIGNTRLMGTVVEASHDENGIIWPGPIAPFDVHLVYLGNDEEVLNKAESLYKDLTDAGFEVLYDDRDERAGVKLNDADLIGVPLRILVSKKTLEKQGVEWKERGSSEGKIVKLDALTKEIEGFIDR